MHKLSHILRLGLKELTSLRHDSVLLLFLFYAFTVAIYMPAAGSIIGVHNASVAIVDEDHSALSRKLAESLLPPEFQQMLNVGQGFAGLLLNASVHVVADLPGQVNSCVMGNDLAHAFIGVTSRPP